MLSHTINHAYVNLFNHSMCTVTCTYGDKCLLYLTYITTFLKYFTDRYSNDWALPAGRWHTNDYLKYYKLSWLFLFLTKKYISVLLTFSQAIHMTQMLGKNKKIKSIKSQITWYPFHPQWTLDTGWAWPPRLADSRPTWPASGPSPAAAWCGPTSRERSLTSRQPWQHKVVILRLLM